MSQIIFSSRKNKVRAYIKNKFSVLHLNKLISNFRNFKHKDVCKDETQFVHLLNQYPLYPAKGTKINNRICLMITKESAIYKAALKACDFFSGNVDVLDPLKSEWSVNEIKSKYDGVIYRPVFKTNLHRQFSNEQIELLRMSGIPVWPNRTENFLYEAKRQTAMYLKAKKIPMPKTSLFYDMGLALKSIPTFSFPMLIKTNVGASSSGIFLVESKKEAVKTVNYIFSKGLLRKGAQLFDIDIGYVLFQEFLVNIREYRIIKIGQSWFGHEKKGKNGSVFFSGSGYNLWDIPSQKVFDLCSEISAENNFNIMSFDVFETEQGKLLINEAQTWFGGNNPGKFISQMYKNGKPGRYVKNSNVWRFEEGIFNYNQSLNLRIFEFDSYLTSNDNKHV